MTHQPQGVPVVAALHRGVGRDLDATTVGRTLMIGVLLPWPQ
ncbi:MULTISPECIES: hypothetical protein [Kribbella]|nr:MULTISPECIES: hypothetical protein [Kribbella]